MCHQFNFKRWLFLGALVPLLLVACGGDEETTAQPTEPAATQEEPQELTTIDIGAITASNYSPLVIAQEKGIFREHGLDANFNFISGSSSDLIPALVRGDLQYLTVTPFNVFGPALEGLDLKIVANLNTLTEDPPSGVLVKPDSGITGPENAGGPRTWCLPSIGSASQALIQAWILAAGGDWESLEWVAVPFPAMNDAILSGQCVGAFVPAPFHALGEERGLTAVGNPTFAFGPAGVVPNGMVMTSGAYAEENPDDVQKFIAAIGEATTYARENPDEVRALLPSYTGITPEEASEAELEIYTSEISLESLQRYADLAFEIGYIDGQIDFEELLVEGAPLMDE